LKKLNVVSRWNKLLVKYFVFASLLYISLDAYSADWQKVEESKGESIYVDVNSIEKLNGFVYYSELIDFKEAIYGALSRISEFKVDCEKKEKANLSITSYTGQMGKFIIINEAKNDGTRFIKSPQSITMRFACDRVM